MYSTDRYLVVPAMRIDHRAYINSLSTVALVRLIRYATLQLLRREDDYFVRMVMEERRKNGAAPAIE